MTAKGNGRQQKQESFFYCSRQEKTEKSKKNFILQFNTIQSDQVVMRDKRKS